MKKLRLLANSRISAMAIAWFGFALPFCTIVIIYGTLFSENSGIDTHTDVIIVASIYLINLGLYVVSFMQIPRWFSWIELSEAGVNFKTIGMKDTTIPYKEYRCFRIVYRKKIPFLIMSRKYISAQEQAHISQLSNDDATIKIRLTRKKYYFLCNIFDASSRDKLARCINGDVTICQRDG